MVIIANRTFLFQQEEIIKNEKSGELTPHVKASIQVRNIPQPQQVPDWIAETDLFKLAVEDGNILEVNAETARPMRGIDNNPKPIAVQQTQTPVAPVVGAPAPAQQPAQGGQAQGQQQGGWATPAPAQQPAQGQ